MFAFGKYYGQMNYINRISEQFNKANMFKAIVATKLGLIAFEMAFSDSSLVGYIE